MNRHFRSSLGACLCLVGSLFCAGASAQAIQDPINKSFSHQHAAPPSGNLPPGMIDGAKNPEKIPDSEAYALFFIHTANILTSPQTTSTQAQAQVNRVGLLPDDERTLVSALKAFKAQFESQVQLHNQAVMDATAHGLKPTSFIPERDALVKATRALLAKELTPAGVSTLDAHVQSEKRHMVISDPAALVSH